ncbi:MAG: response regulator transcription factor [Thiobacillaceae bacterium]
MNQPVVYIVDDDEAVRESFSMLCESAGLKVECHDSAESFLSAYRPECPGCLVLDVRMGGMGGPGLHEELNRRGSHLPIIYLTGHGDIPMTVRAIKAGAVDFLTKPVDPTHFLDRVEAYLQRDINLLDHQEAMAEKCRRLELLTRREREVMALALAGLVSKAIAKRLGISHRTVEVHRSRLLQKTATGNLLELAQLAADCEAALLRKT